MKRRLQFPGKHGLELLVLAAYILLSLGFCYPLPLRMDTDVGGRYVDTRVFQWNNWWLKYALLNGLDVDYSDFIYYPSGASLVSHNMNWVSSFISIPLDALFGPIVAYNLTFLLSFFQSAYGMYVLVRHLTGHRGAAFVAGLVFAFSPYHVSGNFDGQMNLANIQWIPLCVLYVLRVADHRRWLDAVWAGLFAALSSLDCWFFTIFLGMWGGLFLVYYLVFEWKNVRWRTITLLALAVGVALLLLSPFLVPLIIESVDGSVTRAVGYFADDKSSDLMAFVTPSSDHPLLSRYVASAYARYKHWRPAFLGYSVLALAVYAAIATRRRSVLWLLSWLLFTALALGTTLTVGGTPYPAVPMPFRLLIEWVPALKIIRQTSRFNVMVTLSIAVLVGLACADLGRRVQRLLAGRSAAWIAPGGLVLIGALVLFEYLALPCPLSTAQVSPFYHSLAQEDGDFVLLELPIDDFHSREYLYPQTIHHKKSVNGYVARTPSRALAFIGSHPLLKKLQMQIEIDPAVHDIPVEMAGLAANNIRYVIVHKRRLPPQPPVDEAVLASWQELFGPDAYYEDDELVVYRMAPAPSRALVGSFGEELGLVEIDARRVRLLDQQLLAVRARWVALGGIPRDYSCRLSLTGIEGPIARTEAELISLKYPTSQWRPGVVMDDLYAIPIDSRLPEGDYVLTLSVVDPASGEELGALERSIHIDRDAGAFVPALDSIESPAGITYGDEMRLLGYTPHQEAGRLVIEMYWQALQAMSANYKVFVHLVHPADGTIVTQVDTMPRNWSYPTSRWARREVFVDRIELNVVGIEPGEYRLAVGVYEPGSDRLRATDADGNHAQDGRVFLDKAIEVRAP